MVDATDEMKLDLDKMEAEHKKRTAALLKMPLSQLMREAAELALRRAIRKLEAHSEIPDAVALLQEGRRCALAVNVLQEQGK